MSDSATPLNPHVGGDLLRFRALARGRFATIAPALALRVIGRRDEVHPRDAWAAVWRDEQLAEFSCEANRLHYGHRVWGPVPIDGGLLEVVDLTPTIRAYGGPVTDPALPDDWKPVTRGGQDG